MVLATNHSISDYFVCARRTRSSALASGGIWLTFSLPKEGVEISLGASVEAKRRGILSHRRIFWLNLITSIISFHSVFYFEVSVKFHVLAEYGLSQASGAESL